MPASTPEEREKQRLRDALKGKLFPCVRAHVTFELKNATLFEERNQNRSEKARGFESTFLHFPFCEQLAVGLLHDQGESFRHVRDVELWDWKMNFKEAMDIAILNLQAISPADFRQVEPGVSLWVASWHDEHTAARLLLPELFTRLEVRGEVVVLAPTADHLLVVDSADSQALLLLFEIGASLRGEPRPIPMQPMYLKNGAWDYFKLEAGADCFEAWKLFCLAALNVAYEIDAERITRSSKDAIFAPLPEVVQDETTGALYTRTVVPEGRRTSAPRCDYLEFFKAADDGQYISLGVCTLDHAMEVLGNRIEVEPGYPPRVSIKSFPDRNQIPLLGFARASMLPVYVPPEPVSLVDGVGGSAAAELEDVVEEEEGGEEQESSSPERHDHQL